MLSMCDNSAALVVISLIVFIDTCIFHGNHCAVITFVNIIRLLGKTTRFLVAIMYSSSRRFAAYEPMGGLHVIFLGVGALRTAVLVDIMY